ncbi:discoidin domain-containing protein [Streptomyces sp. NPDC056707]|uniref:discoidin domain-containing protein n=1 Tax=Streptomyces sp. NPDC056707 TaxID=3345919 RepID=UPI0036B1E440
MPHAPDGSRSRSSSRGRHAGRQGPGAEAADPLPTVQRASDETAIVRPVVLPAPRAGALSPAAHTGFEAEQSPIGHEQDGEDTEIEEEEIVELGDDTSPARSKMAIAVLCGGAVLGFGLLVMPFLGGGESANQAADGGPAASVSPFSGRPSPKTVRMPGGIPSPSASATRTGTTAPSTPTGSASATRPAQSRKPTAPASSTTKPRPSSYPAPQTRGKPVSASTSNQPYVESQAVDGSAYTYWESSSNFPQWFQVDLGGKRSVGRLLLKLPPQGDWNSRTQTIQVQGSTDGSTYTTLAGTADYMFNSATGNAASITFPAKTIRYLKLTFTANSGWPAAQLSELQAYTS